MQSANDSEISVVIPTRNRKARLLALLESLRLSQYPIREIIIVDASDEPMQPSEYAGAMPPVIYLRSASSVCIQRNAGIRAAGAPWIFLCDDDMEVPPDYLQLLMAHVRAYPASGAVSGIVLQRENGAWTGEYSIRSTRELLLKYVFGLSLWGRIDCSQRSPITRAITRHYAARGNHLSRAGWPVITDFSGTYFNAPVYGLGASLVRRDWLLAAPYDEVLDRHGIGDNYGVALGFPETGIQVLNSAFVYHHHEPANRLQAPLQYYRRVLALDYFLRTLPRLKQIRRRRFLWSLLGNALISFARNEGPMARVAWRTFRQVAAGRNPYRAAAAQGQKVTEPVLL